MKLGLYLLEGEGGNEKNSGSQVMIIYPTTGFRNVLSKKYIF
jgi:hypothetical protein